MENKKLLILNLIPIGMLGVFFAGIRFIEVFEANVEAEHLVDLCYVAIFTPLLLIYLLYSGIYYGIIFGNILGIGIKSLLISLGSLWIILAIHTCINPDGNIGVFTGAIIYNTVTCLITRLIIFIHKKVKEKKGENDTPINEEKRGGRLMIWLYALPMVASLIYPAVYLFAESYIYITIILVLPLGMIFVGTGGILYTFLNFKFAYGTKWNKYIWNFLGFTAVHLVFSISTMSDITWRMIVATAVYQHITLAISWIIAKAIVKRKTKRIEAVEE